MSGARDAFTRLEAALDPLLTDQAMPHAVRRLAALASEAGDFVRVAEHIIPVILAAEDAAETLTAAAKRLRQVMAEVMDETGATTIKGATHTASATRGRAGVVITDEAAIPPSLMRVPPPAPDKAAIAKLLKAGEVVPGAVLGNSSPSLTIRSKDT